MVQEIENQRFSPLKTESFLSDSSDPIINFFLNKVNILLLIA